MILLYGCLESTQLQDDTSNQTTVIYSLLCECVQKHIQSSFTDLRDNDEWNVPNVNITYYICVKRVLISTIR